MSNWDTRQMPDQSGTVAIVTGANTGIGYETARALAEKGAQVVIACRNTEKGEAARNRILAAHPEAAVELIQLDLSSLESVRRFAADFTGRYEKLDRLINNAGVMMPSQRTETADGFEVQFGVNHLGHFLLTGLLLDHLKKTPGARVVSLSSNAHSLGRIDFDNLNAEKSYSRSGTYSQSKLANLLFTCELQRRCEAAGVDITALAAHPGWTATDLQRHSGIFDFFNPVFGQTVEMGALPTLYAATVPDLPGATYYGPGGFMGWRGYPGQTTSNRRSHDRDVAKKLWEVSEELVGISYL